MSDIVFDLAPVRTSVERAAETTIYRTLLGKRNRITVGHPVSRRVVEVDGGTLLEAKDLERFTPEEHDFWMVEMALTLMPDRACRFASCDLWLELDSARGDLPLFWRLRPDRLVQQKSVRLAGDTTASAGLGSQIREIVDLNGSTTMSREEEWQTTMVGLESFGAGSSVAGWRLSLTEAGEIPLCTEGLALLCVLPSGTVAGVRINARAEIKIAGVVDRWATATLRGASQAGLESRISIGRQ